MIEFFEFSWGSDIRRYTTSPTEVTWNGHTWTPTEITRGQIKLEAKLEASDVTIDCGVGGDVPALFKARAPIESVGVTIYRGDESDLAGTTQSIWMGEVAKVIFGPAVAKLTCSPTISLGRGRLPIGRFSVGCRWQLYSPACGLDVENWKNQRSLVARFPADKTVRIVEGPYTAEDMIGGFYIDPEQTRHLIISSSVPSAGQIDMVFERWPAALSVGASAVFAPGCNHSLANCRKFSNAYNFGGFPALPTKN